MVKLYKLFAKVEQQWSYTNTKRFVKYHRSKGILIGENLRIFGGISTIRIDLTRTSLIEIGNSVSFNRNFTLLTHDYIAQVFIHKYKEFLPSSGKVKIGSNVSFGQNCTVLKGVTIGDNCFIGYGSIVTKDIPANCVAAGAPAKVVCTLDEYFEKRKKQCINEAYVYARSIKERFNRRPVIADFKEEFPLFMDGSEEHPDLPIKRLLLEAYTDYKKNHKAMFKGFEDFLNKAGV